MALAANLPAIARNVNQATAVDIAAILMPQIQELINASQTQTAAQFTTQFTAVRNEINAVQLTLVDVRTDIEELKNSNARVRNSLATRSEDILTAISVGGATPQHFPATRHHLENLSLHDVNALLTFYGLANAGTLAVKKERVKAHMGIA